MRKRNETKISIHDYNTINFRNMCIICVYMSLYICMVYIYMTYDIGGIGWHFNFYIQMAGCRLSLALQLRFVISNTP